MNTTLGSDMFEEDGKNANVSPQSDLDVIEVYGFIFS